MRVTQAMLSNQMTNNIQRNTASMYTIQEQLSTGKKINRPSDDPVGLNHSLRYRSEISANEQYQRNLDTAISWLDVGDSTLGQAVDVLQLVREKTVGGADGSNSNESLQAIAQEIDQLAEELQEIANTQFNGKYIFNGQKTDQPPYPDGWEELGSDLDPGAGIDQGNIVFEVSRGVHVQVNQNAADIFGAWDDQDNVFQLLADISTALREGKDGQGDVDAALGRLDERIDTVLEQWTELGARSNRVQLIDNRLKDQGINTQSLLSKTEDVDYAETISRLLMEENVYRASLSAGSRIIQPSLIDFLR